jgi:hypothetical protein
MERRTMRKKAVKGIRTLGKNIFRRNTHGDESKLLRFLKRIQGNNNKGGSELG